MKKSLTIASKIENLRIVEKAIDEISGEIGIKQDNYGKILVSVLEAVNNAIVHGNKGMESKNVKVEFNFQIDVLSVLVCDEGPGFDPKSIPDPTKSDNIEKLNGRGVFLMSRLADEIEFNDSGNEVTMLFKGIRT